MKQLKILFGIILTVSILYLFQFCKKDDDTNSNNTSNSSNKTITFDGITYNIKGALVEDYGYGNYGTWFGSSEDSILYYNYDFTIGNGNLVEDSIYWDFDSLTTFTIYCELFSPSTTFQIGTFVYMNGDDTTLQFSDANKKYFEEVDVFIQDTDTSFNASDGSISVSGSPNNYTIEYDLILEGGKSLNGTYSGAFTYVDETENRNRNIKFRKIKK